MQDRKWFRTHMRTSTHVHIRYVTYASLQENTQECESPSLLLSDRLKDNLNFLLSYLLSSQSSIYKEREMLLKRGGETVHPNNEKNTVVSPRFSSIILFQMRCLLSLQITAISALKLQLEDQSYMRVAQKCFGPNFNKKFF